MQKSLSESSMYFKTENGDEFVLSNTDISNIASDLFSEMVMNAGHKIFIVNDAELQRARLLYQIIQDEGKSMKPELKDKYLKAILEHITKYELDLKTLTDELINKELRNGNK